MNKKILSEINRVKTMMGLLNEASIPLSLSDEVIEGLLKIIKKPSRVFIDDINTLKNINKGITTASPRDVENIIRRLIRSDKKAADFILSRIINNLDVPTKNFLNDFKASIVDFKKSGGSYKDALENIKINMNAQIGGRPVVQTTIPEIKDYITKDLEKYAYEVYNPIKSKVSDLSKKVGKESWEKFKSGLKDGREAKSGGGLTLKSFGNWWKNRFATIRERELGLYKLSPEEKKVVKNYLFWGIPDVPAIKNTAKKFGIRAASTNLLTQLVKKFIVLYLLKTFWLTIWSTIKDQRKKGTEYENYSDWAIFWYRVAHFAKDPPSFGFVSPGLWLLGLILVPFIKAQRGADGAWWKSFKEYLTGDDEFKIPAPPRDIVTIIDTTNQRVSRYAETQIERIDTAINQIRQGNNVDTSDIIPNSETVISDTIPPVGVDTPPPPVPRRRASGFFEN
jgi:hypothetical protein